MNLEVQLLLKQGQIEVGKCDFVHSYTDALLIHRSAVEELNAVIKVRNHENNIQDLHYATLESCSCIFD